MTFVLPRRLLLAALPVLLAACGGSGHDDGSAAPPQAPSMVGDVPSSALADASAYARFVAAEATRTGTQALRLGDLTPPVSDTDAPLPVQ